MSHRAWWHRYYPASFLSFPDARLESYYWIQIYKLGSAMRDDGPILDLNGKPFGRANAGADMTFDFGRLIAHAAKTRPLGAGAIVGSGTVSNKLDGGPGKAVSESGAGYSCLAEMRTVAPA